jgi:DNA-binding transcriptional LysR family regulator
VLTDERGEERRFVFTPRLVTSDPALLLAAAIAGCGVCRLPAFCAEPHLQNGELVPVLPGFVAERHEIALAVLRRERDPAVAAFAREAPPRLAAILRRAG